MKLKVKPQVLNYKLQMLQYLTSEEIGELVYLVNINNQDELEKFAMIKAKEAKVPVDLFIKGIGQMMQEITGKDLGYGACIESKLFKLINYKS